MGDWEGIISSNLVLPSIPEKLGSSNTAVLLSALEPKFTYPDLHINLPETVVTAAPLFGVAKRFSMYICVYLILEKN